MDDEVLVRVCDCRAYLAEQFEPVTDRELMRAAVLVDRLAIDVLHDEVRDAFAGGPTVEQTRDIWVREAGKDLPFVAETLKHRISVHAALDHLDRDAHLELRVGALPEIDGTHPSAAKLADDAKGADLSSIGRHRRRDACDVRRRLGDEAARLLVRVQQAFDLLSQSSI